MKTEILNKLRSEGSCYRKQNVAELAHALVRSLDAPYDANASEASWDKEILRRLAEIDRDEFRRRMQVRLYN